MRNLNVSRTIDVALDKAWSVVSDVGGYAHYAPNILTSKILSGQGLGMVRECSSKEGCWQELCTHWQENNSYAFQVQTQAKDYPYPFSVLNARWSVKTEGPNRTTVILDFDVEFRNKVLGWVLFPILKRKYLNVCDKLMENWRHKCMQD